MSKTSKEVRVIVEWINADYFDISNYLEDTFSKSFSGSGTGMDGSCDAGFWVKENQVNSFISLVQDEMEKFRGTFNELEYRVGRCTDFYTPYGDRVEGAAPLV